MPLQVGIEFRDLAYLYIASVNIKRQGYKNTCDKKVASLDLSTVGSTSNENFMNCYEIKTGMIYQDLRLLYSPTKLSYD